MAVSELFRAEALAYRRQRLEGDVILTKSLPLIVVTGLLTLFTIVILLWAFLGHYTRSEQVQGVVTPDGVLAKVYADRPGRLVWLGVREGDVVREGQPIATVRTEQELESGVSPDAQRLASVGEQATLNKLQLEAENGRADQERKHLVSLIGNLRRERLQLAAQLDLQQQSVNSTRQSFNALTGLVDKGFVSRTDYERRRQEWLVTATQHQALIQQIAQLDERLSDAEAGLAKLPLDHAGKVADLHNSLDQIDQRRIDIENARAFSITAPIAGRVTSVQAMAGRTSDGRLPLLSIVPLGAKMQVTLYAPSRAIGMAHVGQDVRLMYDAFPYQRFGSFKGHIVQVSRSVLAPDEVDAPIRFQEPVYALRVALERQQVSAFGETLPLQPGMTLAADVILDRRSFLDWILEPIRAVSERS